MAAKKKTKKTTKKKSVRKTAAKKTTKRAVKKKAVKKTAKKSVQPEAQAAQEIEDIPLPFESKTTTSGIRKEVAVTSFILNIIFAGAGTLLIREFASATLQILLYLIGLAIVLTVNDIATGLVIGLIATAWALFDSYNAYKRAK